MNKKNCTVCYQAYYIERHQTSAFQDLGSDVDALINETEQNINRKNLIGRAADFIGRAVRLCGQETYRSMQLFTLAPRWPEE